MDDAIGMGMSITKKKKKKKGIMRKYGTGAVRLSRSFPSVLILLLLLAKCGAAGAVWTNIV